MPSRTRERAESVRQGGALLNPLNLWACPSCVLFKTYIGHRHLSVQSNWHAAREIQP
ncbi:hypothetical protein SAMD00079811_22810 [Scytonema sp. HK-05]|uniref:hypothetical protein n=1 Tax=Scytonema sp. HK-05 TaxID=1137095 RepID=UPI000AF22F06|nr:hypothetical protein [Scytonema sp. HK-05]BAY44680.1 hypothetical protein SAMD00079811_22810 [Scytonema sp. HK-05]